MIPQVSDLPEPERPLRRGWTTGACALAGAVAAVSALRDGGDPPDPVTITLPGGREPSFPLAVSERGEGWVRAGVVKDAGDDPDVTHGALVWARVIRGAPGSGIVFTAGEGVGTVTLPGLPLAVGEPAINPAPRRMITEALTTLAGHGGAVPDLTVEIGVVDGAEIARRTWNPRLGILGGLSILGTTGVVIPYSCSAWIASIHRGIDVAVAAGHAHVIAATGDTSERAAQARLGLPDSALLDMGDFAGATLTYLARHPVARLTLAGGVGKLSKLAAGHLDLHSARSQVSTPHLAGLAHSLGADDGLAGAIEHANTALHAWELARAAGVPLADGIAAAARDVAVAVLKGAPVAVEVLVVDRAGEIVGRAGP